MARKIVFLDFDGPIATEQSYAAAYPENQLISKMEPERLIDDVLVKRVEAICAEADAYIVLSTSWALMQGSEWCSTMLYSKGVTKGRVIGATPRRMSNYFRGNEIDWWLEKNRDVSREDYVILDDDKDFHPHQLPRLIVTPFNLGITEEQVKQVISMLRTQQ